MIKLFPFKTGRGTSSHTAPLPGPAPISLTQQAPSFSFVHVATEMFLAMPNSFLRIFLLLHSCVCVRACVCTRTCVPSSAQKYRHPSTHATAHLWNSENNFQVSALFTMGMKLQAALAESTEPSHQPLTVVLQCREQNLKNSREWFSHWSTCWDPSSLSCHPLPVFTFCLFTYQTFEEAHLTKCLYPM